MEKASEVGLFPHFCMRVKGGEGWVKGQSQPFTPANALFMGFSGQKVKGEGFFFNSPFTRRFSTR